MNRARAREWTRGLFLRHLGDEPDAYRDFLRLVSSSCPEGGRVVDLGCGEEGYLAFLAPKAGEIVGVDDRPLQGPYTRYIQADLNRDIPLQGESVDLAAGKFLLEHLDNPPEFLHRAHRILCPQGTLVLMAPNILYYPYAMNYLLSRLLSQERRMRLVRLITGRTPGEVYPVYYRCNTPRKMREELERCGFEVLHLRTYSDYLVSAVSRPLGALAVAYEKVVNVLGITRGKGFIVAQARKR